MPAEPSLTYQGRLLPMILHSRNSTSKLAADVSELKSVLKVPKKSADVSCD